MNRFITIKNTIYYPEGLDPFQYPVVIEHELVHVKQWERLGSLGFLLLYFILPLPLLFSGRWFLEREAYLKDIEAGELSANHVTYLLWSEYFFSWPKPLMRRWFKKNT